ncbi:hypothetical protein FPZ54_11040 [Sphingomonas suaedae]|uniref:DUF6438 domain-containing protein n=1 Tax=Sphingomonas suaedae TaxID=2599297 RepID=A0A518RGD3_9SPHN|nr:DUF6438 domain-containing protein [Sphingomonas suaedae]QDX26506.1 hypothetical protein FPZ54_11040 [Sphingomonas suaedae]
MKRLGLIVVLGLAMAGCARTPGPEAPPAAPFATQISYSTGPCFGACPVYAFTVQANGDGSFEGKRFTQTGGTKRFKLSRADYDAFAAALAPYRPAPGTSRRYSQGEKGCERAATDLPSAEVTWVGPDGKSQLYYYFGCDMEANRAMADAIGNAPDLIPALAPLIGERP